MGPDLTLILVAALAFFSVAGVGFVFAGEGGGTQKKRVKAVTGDPTTRVVKKKGQVSALDQAAQRRKQVQETLKDLEEKQKKQRKRTVTLKARINQAGLNISVTTFWLMSLGLGAAVGGVLWLQGRPLLLVAAAAFIVALGVPRWFLGFLRGRRMKSFAQEFVNAIDIIVRGVKTGLPLGECLVIIANESAEPVRSEFKRLVDNAAVGVPLDEGLNRMYERMPLAELNFFAIVLIIQQKTGGNLSETLNNLSVVLRARKMMREKISALSSEAKASALIIGSLPPLVTLIVHLTSPDYMVPLFTERMGHMMLLGGLTWMGAGIFIMRRMINFKI